MDSKNNNDAGQFDDTPGLAPPAARRIYLVRHGVTEWNKLFRYQGATDIPLSSEGEEQAERAGLRLSQFAVDRIISSPLQRSLMTAGKIASLVGVANVETWDELREVDFGDWEGLTVPEIIARYGQDVFNAWRTAQSDVKAANGEEPRSVYERSGGAAARLRAFDDEVVVVVSHGAIFRSLLLHFIEAPRSSVFWKMRMDNCSISAIEIDRRRRSSVRFFNDTVHLYIEREKVHLIPLQ